jgi:hypothetical protein
MIDKKVLKYLFFVIARGDIRPIVYYRNTQSRRHA